MPDPLTLADLAPDYAAQLTTQDYPARPQIAGVQLVGLNLLLDDGGGPRRPAAPLLPKRREAGRLQREAGGLRRTRPRRSTAGVRGRRWRGRAGAMP